jgi:hypothetical protein
MKVGMSRLFNGMPFLFEKYNFVETGRPDFIIFYDHVKQMPKGKYVKIFYTGENIRPDMHRYDWAFSFDHLKHPRHFRLPNYRRVGAGRNLIKPKDYDAEKILESKKKFCAFVYHNPNAKVRNRFFDRLSRYKRIDAPGRCKNNMPPYFGHKSHRTMRYNIHAYRDKIRFLRDYKFVIAFENVSHPGYTTEKLYHPMLANCIAIYWGNPLVRKDFNTKSFINFADLGSMNKMIAKVVELDKNDDLYLEYLRQPWYPGNRVTSYVNEKRIMARFKQIFGV